MDAGDGCCICPLSSGNVERQLVQGALEEHVQLGSKVNLGGTNQDQGDPLMELCAAGA